MRITPNAPSFTHLFFADDSMLSLVLTSEVAEVLKFILETYEEVTRQQVNFHKSAITFSPNTPEDLMFKIADYLGIPVVECHERYLGLPTLAGRGKRVLFSSIKQKVEVRLNGWQEKFLSLAGKRGAYKVGDSSNSNL